MASDSALTKRPPTQEERFLIHDLYLEYSQYDDPKSKTKKPDDVEWMADTKMSAIHIMQPQDRNIHDKVTIPLCSIDVLQRAISTISSDRPPILMGSPFYIYFDIFTL